MNNIILGNIFSLIASFFLVLSCISKTRKKAYFYQMMESLLLCFSSVCFGMWAGLITLIISVFRNILVIIDRMNQNMLILFSILGLIFGIIVNDKGIIGLMPVIGTIQLTVCSYLVTSMIGTKLSFLCNIIIWAIYSLLILDFSAGITQIIIAIITIISILKNK